MGVNEDMASSSQGAPVPIVHLVNGSNLIPCGRSYSYIMFRLMRLPSGKFVVARASLRLLLLEKPYCARV